MSTSNPTQQTLLAGGLGGGGPLEEWPGLQKPCQLDLQQFMDALGVSPLASPAVLQVARRAHGTPYPPHWSEELDAASGALYFYHDLRDESSWQHPLVDCFREVLELVGGVVAERMGIEDLAGRIEGALLEAQQRAVEELSSWEGPISYGNIITGGTGGSGAGSAAAAGGAAAGAAAPEPLRVYFYNRSSGQSSWEDPRERWQYDLRVRYDLLVGFLVAMEKGSTAAAQPLRTPDITTTLTSLASSMTSMASTLSNAVIPAAGTGVDGEASEERAPPRTPRFGALKLPPRAVRPTAGGSKKDDSLFSMPPHQQRYTADVLQQPAAGAGGSGSARSGGSPSKKGAAEPPPPPAGAPPRY